jgi:hypothetical protein
MQRLDAAFHHLGEARVVGDVGDDDAVQAQELRGAAGGEELDAVGEQRLGEVDDARLVGDAEECALNLDNWGQTPIKLMVERTQKINLIGV